MFLLLIIMASRTEFLTVPAVMLALNRYAQLLLAPVTPGEKPIDSEEWNAIEDEMERLALEALPNARSLPPDIQSVISALSPEQAGAMLLHLFRTSARQFRHARHQKNILRGAAVHLVAHHGSPALPPELQKRFPGLGMGRRDGGQRCDM